MKTETTIMIAFRVPIPLLKEFDKYWRNRQYRDRTKTLHALMELAVSKDIPKPKERAA